jgi:transposase
MNKDNYILYKDPEWLKEQYLVLRKSTVQIANELNISNTTVYEWLLKFKIKIRGKRKAILGNEKWLKEQYLVLQKSMSQIAKETDSDKRTVSNYLKFFDIKARSPSAILLHGKEIFRNEKFLYEQYVILKKSTTEIANEIAIEPSTVCRWLHYYNITVRTISENRLNGKQKLAKEELNYLYNICGKSLPQISKETGFGCSTVSRWLREYNICSRTISESTKGKFKGDKHPNWKGGISYLPYCKKFGPMREQVREAFGRKCFLCGFSENGRKLDVHHCDFNKNQGCAGSRGWKLVPLCKHCHAKTTNHRFFYFMLLANYWAMNSNINFNLPGIYWFTYFI